LNEEKNYAIIALKSTDFAKRFLLLDGIKLLGHTLRLSLYQDIKEDDVNSSNIGKAMSLANSANLSAKSAALAYAAFQSFAKNEEIVTNTNSLNSNNYSFCSRFLKIFGLVDVEKARKFRSKDFESLKSDIQGEFERYGRVISCVVIDNKLERIGAECGSIFMEFENAKYAENAQKGIKGRRYEGKHVKTAFIEEDVYKKEILENMEK